MAERANRSPGVDLDRRRISVLSALTLLGGATLTISGCGGGGDGGPAAPSASSPAPASCPTGSRCGLVSRDPLHSAEITAAQLSAGGALTLNIQGNQTHGHVISLSADEVVAIRDGRQVRKDSSTELNHSHSVIFN
jgi:hypothetical protein